MRNERVRGLKYSPWKQRMTVLLLAIMALGFVSGCGEKEQQRDPFSKDDVGQHDVENYEDVSDTDNVDRDSEIDAETDVETDAETDAEIDERCAQGSMRCSSLGHAEVCTDNDWAAHETCMLGCVDGECTTEVSCNAGDFRCNDHNVEVCNQDGSAFLHVSTCQSQCISGLCSGACTPGESRCNGNQVEVCNSTGTDWEFDEACTTFCAVGHGKCALKDLIISADTMLDGTIVVDGPVRIESGTLLHSPAGELNIYAKSIVVESNGVIDAAATGQNPAGRGADGRSLYCENATRSTGGRGGSYGTQAEYPRCHELSQTSAMYGSDLDANVEAGSPGGNGAHAKPPFHGFGGPGGGVIRLFADTIRIDGKIVADGGPGRVDQQPNQGTGGGGSGGGILLAADSLTVTGTIQTKGGPGGQNSRPQHYGSDGGDGRIKLLYGAHGEITGTMIGAKTQGILPPPSLSSPTHPDPALIYNDDFSTAGFAWEKPFPSVTGYRYSVSKTRYSPPQVIDPHIDVPLKYLSSDKFTGEGLHYFHVVSVNQASEVGQIENSFAIQINAKPPGIVSASHPDKNDWYNTAVVAFAWEPPNGDENVRNYYYVLDRFGDTIPTKNDTPLSSTTRSLNTPALQSGIWSLHLIASDTQGRLTKRAAHYRVKIGENPGEGNVLGTIVDQNAQPVIGATVTVNRGLLLPQTPNGTSNGTGNYDMASVPAGSWELRVSATGYESKDVVIQVNDGQPTSANITLKKL